MAALQRITRKFSEERATVLAKEAVELSHSGDKVQASRKLREAAALGHDNTDVHAAFLAIHNDQIGSPLRDLCRRYACYHNIAAGDEAVSYLKSADASNAAPVALECLQIILENQAATLSAAQDFIIAELVRQSQPVRQYIASELQASTTEFFENVYERGDDAANCLRSVVLDDKLWSSEDVRLRVEDDLFQLFLAKLMETGHDHDGRALKGIALLLIADTQRLHTFIDEDAFEALMGSLDPRLPPEVRGQATLVLSKFFEVDEITGQDFLYRYIRTHVERQKGDDLILAFSAGAHLFPVVPSMMAHLFLTDGFLVSIMPLLARNLGSPTVHDAFLMLVNAACLDGACRAAIAQYCSTWLAHKVSNGTGKQPSMAATILAKLRTSGAKAGDQRANRADEDVSELVDLFKSTLSVEDGRNVSDSIEGLAYTSLKPEVKESLAQDRAFLKSLLEILNANQDSPEVIVGGLSIISNLTQYVPSLSEEQKRISQLKAYANATTPSEPSPLENDDHVRARCSAVVEAGVVATLSKLNRGRSPATAQLTDRILLSLSKNPKDRGKMAQQGAVKLLIMHALRNLESSENNTSTEAAQALARLLISLNPAHAFASGSTPHITDAVPPLVALIKAPRGQPLSDQPRDLLAVFESLLALTNLASAPEPTAANSIIKSAWEDVEDLLLGNNTMLRRAACELICNLTVYPAAAEKFVADRSGSGRPSQRLHLLVAMADVDDLPTRRAAGGALAMLTEQYSSVVSALLEFDRTPEILLELCHDDDPGAVHRGLVVVRNMVCCDEEDPALAEKARVAFKSHDAVEELKNCLKKTNDPTLLQIGVEALKVLVE
ncbi:SWI5-dependent HO expression protein 4 [Exophiala xenobiotica]|nr:SWI5-dependent HO expression protein 4 [Exophiala xenobiotica]KAK5380569.1 SWI5-dependent HO expression protein 4 [Exophiala xenobiotica]KAK5392937.1 SWI5-dependent HO expression protein 4 [Exophiala xenobiotica]KAK5411992.1 SWI5-dependent HO expression protein 4 [Exophiala xenobiotica]KAK5447548.1 SWI5-dependent HO expression protein 4 [Exophiala xenobiotica]